MGSNEGFAGRKQLQLPAMKGAGVAKIKYTRMDSKFHTAEAKYPQTHPTLVPVLLQGQQETPRVGKDKFRSSLQRGKALLLQEGAGDRKDKESECLGCPFPNDRDFSSSPGSLQPLPKAVAPGKTLSRL